MNTPDQGYNRTILKAHLFSIRSFSTYISSLGSLVDLFYCCWEEGDRKA